MSAVRFAQVTTVNTLTRQVDLVFLDTNQRCNGVDVMTGSVSAAGGSWDIPTATPPSSEQTAGTLGSGARMVAACVFTAEGTPVVIGWCQPRGSEMVFAEGDREVRRHQASGTYVTVAPDGSYEVCTGSTYFRIGSGGHQDLSTVAGGGPGGVWNNPGATGHQVSLATAGFLLTIMPNGTTTMQANSGHVTVQTNAGITLDTPTVTCTGDVVISGISFLGHVHGGIKPGNANTTQPV